MNKSLFHIKQEYLALNEQIMAEEGVLTPETEQALAINQAELEKKGEGYAWVIKKNEAECDIIDAEIKRLTALKKSRETANNRLKQAVKDAMTLYGLEEIKTPLIRISFRKSTSTEVEDIEKVPAEYVKVSVTKTADKTAIKDAIQVGKEVPGAYLKQNSNIQIK